MDKNKTQKYVKNEIWNKFCEKLKQIFKGKFCIYPSREDIDELKTTDDPSGLLEDNYYSLVEPTNWELKVLNNKVGFSYNKVKKNKASNCLKRSVMNFIKKNKSELNPTETYEWNIENIALMYSSVGNPILLADGLNKVGDKLAELLRESGDSSKKSSVKAKKFLSRAKTLYEGLKKLEYHAKILKQSLGDSKEDNDYIIERERPRNFLWQILGKIGFLGRDAYQEISDDNGSKEFTLKSLFERSQIYRKMVKVFMDCSSENEYANLEQSLKRKLLRILVALKKWVELYTVKPTTINGRGKLSEILTTEVNKFLKFSASEKKEKKEKNYNDLNGNRITPSSLIVNIGNIQAFLKAWSRVRLTKKFIHNIKNIKIKDVAEDLYETAKELKKTWLSDNPGKKEAD